MIDYFVRFIPLPWHVKGFVTPNDDDTYSIYINSLLPDAVQRAALEHELRHIRNGDLYSDEPVVEIEARTARCPAERSMPEVYDYEKEKYAAGNHLRIV